MNHLSLFSLKNQAVLITGAAGGMGYALAHIFARAGAVLVLTDRHNEPLTQLASDLKEQYEKVAHIHTFTSDLGNTEGAEKVVPEADALTGGIDILINNAGITSDSMAHKMTDEAWEQVLEVNLTSAFRLARAAIKSMRNRHYGRIVNIASVVGVTGNMGQANYVASKAGLIGLTKTLALEGVRYGITTNAIAPGFIETAMTSTIPDDVMQKILAKIPAGHLGQPTDIATAALFLASQEAAYITGHTLHVNGGMVMV